MIVTWLSHDNHRDKHANSVHIKPALYIMGWSHTSHMTYVKYFGVSNDNLLGLHETSDDVQSLQLMVG